MSSNTWMDKYVIIRIWRAMKNDAAGEIPVTWKTLQERPLSLKCSIRHLEKYVGWLEVYTPIYYQWLCLLDWIIDNLFFSFFPIHFALLSILIYRREYKA